VIILGFESDEEKGEGKKKRFKPRNHDNSIMALSFLYAIVSSCCLVLTLLREFFHETLPWQTDSVSPDLANL
jgi:hypothetical protein